MTQIVGKLGRNDICYCGSGKKYKRCCMDKNHFKELVDKKPMMSQNSIFEALAFGLNVLCVQDNDERKIKVKKIGLLNANTIECQFYAYYSDSTDIKMEISTIMGFLYGFFKEDSFSEIIQPKYFAVRAYSLDDTGILYAYSSLEIAGLASNGNVIDWLKSTLFQENTNDYRLTIAKKQISEIENALRIVIIDVLSKKYGDDWWNLSVGGELSKSIKRQYNEQFYEETEDGSVLIKYSYLLHLKKIICTNWPDFKHFFASKIEFENGLDKLNLIRREEAHNREITETHLMELKVIYYFILPEISNRYPQIVPELLVENWKIKVKEIFKEPLKPLFGEEDVMDEPSSLLKATKSIATINHTVNYLVNTIDKLNSIPVPVQRKKIHDELVGVLIHYKDLHEQLIDCFSQGRIDEMEETVTDLKEYKSKSDSFILKYLLSES
jgi:hypothetical protein